MPVMIPLAKVRKLADPLETTPWVCIPFGRKEIAKSLKARLFESKPVPDDTVNCWPHINRIAYLVCHGWSDPIVISVGVFNAELSWPIIDGNHRLAAAIYRRDKQILVSVDGSLERARKLFGVDCEERAVE